MFAAWEGGGILEGAPDYKSRLVFPSDQEARAHMRHEFRYEGPMPSPADLACFLANDKACAFFHCLQESHHKIVVEELRPVEVELGRLAYEFDLELQRARLQLRGTDGEIVLRRDAPDRAARKYDIEGRRKQANASQEWWTVVNGSGQDTWYHITREQFPRLFELRASEQQTRELRERLLEDRMRDILLREGVGALNPARFVRS